MRKSIDPMRRPEAAEGPLRALIVSMSFQPGIPWRVAPQQSPPPLPRPVTVWVRMEPLESFFQRTATCPYFLCLTTGVQPRLRPGDDVPQPTSRQAVEARLFRPAMVVFGEDRHGLPPTLSAALERVDRQLDALIDHAVPHRKAA